jgi:hypothetical protein
MRLAALVLVACSKPLPVAVGPDPVDATPVTVITPDVATDAAGLPPIDRRCSADTDCDFVALEITGANTCCPSCATTIAARTWTTAVRAICAGAMPATCNPLACPMGITASRCDKGVCVPKL